MFKIIVTITVLIITSVAHSGDTITPLAPDFKLEGQSAAELSATWWKWAMSSPDEINPVRDNSGIHCDVGQQGKIWFLAGGFGSSKIKRTCSIPVGKYLFFPIINMAYWPREENNGYTCEQAKVSAAVNNDTALDLYVEIDGIAVKNPKRFRARTEKCFNIYEKIPKEYNPVKAYPSASDGYWIGLNPLPKGIHSVKFGGRYNSTNSAHGRSVQDIEYQIIVQ